MALDLVSTLKGSLLESFFPKGWDLKKFDKICSNKPSQITTRQPWWNKKFRPVPCDSLGDFETFMGHEIAMLVRRTKEAGRKLALILPVGPMGMYRWASTS